MKISGYRLRKALSEGEFIPFYQPLVCAETGATTGCEVLARWMTPEKGLIKAAQFIGAVERAGLAAVLTRQVATDVLTDFSEPGETFSPGRDFVLTLNVSLSMLMAPACRTWLAAFAGDIRRAGMTPVFEITEREDIRLFPQAEAVFSDLATQGLLFAVDDFGTGYAASALVALSHACFIKIDRRYVRNLAHPAAARFIRQTVCLARQSGARVIAEGVETPEQEAQLRDDGVDFLQGYRYGDAMPAGLFHYRFGRAQVAC